MSLQFCQLTRPDKNRDHFTMPKIGKKIKFTAFFGIFQLLNYVFYLADVEFSFLGFLRLSHRKLLQSNTNFFHTIEVSAEKEDQ